MLRLRLTGDEQAGVLALCRDRRLSPAERDRVAMLCLADAGWGSPAIAAHLGYTPVLALTLPHARRGFLLYGRHLCARWKLGKPVPERSTPRDV